MTSQAKSTAGKIGVFMFFSGIGLMVISDGIDLTFGVGFLFFMICIIMALFAVTWSISGTADRALRRFTDGD